VASGRGRAASGVALRAAPRPCHAVGVSRWLSLLLAVGLTGGGVLCFVVPPFQAPDEWGHLFVARQASALDFAPDTDGETLLCYSTTMERGLAMFAATARAWGLPKRPERKIAPADVLAAARTPFDPTPVVVDYLRFSGAPGLYAPTSYLAPALVLAVGRTVGASPASTFYAARLANLCLFFALVLIACRLGPTLAPAFVAIALTPMVLAVAASLSGDVTAIGCSMLLAALCARALSTDSRIGVRELVAFVVVASFLALAKGVYAALLGVWFFLPARASGGLGRHLAFGGVLVAWCALLIWGWGTVSGEGLALAATMTGLSAAENARFLVEHPLHLVAATARAVLHPRIFEQLLGRLGWLDVPLGWLTLLAAAATLVVGALASALPASSIPAAPRARLLALAVLATGGASVLGLGWLYGVYGYPLGTTSYFPSIQGRHLLPLLPWLALTWALLAGERSGRMRERGLVWVLATSAVAVAGAALAVTARYYE
jgi:hypothetical protein